MALGDQHNRHLPSRHQLRQGSAIEVYDSSFAVAKLAGSFTDSTLPTGYVPYSVHVIGTQVFVTYALRATTGGPTVAPGNGMVNVFDTNGNFVAHAVAPGGNLNAPWGVAIAPATFGVFGGDLLVGNFGDGVINVYDPKTFAYLGQLADGTGKTFTYASLWSSSSTHRTSSTNSGNLNTLCTSPLRPHGRKARSPRSGEHQPDRYRRCNVRLQLRLPLRLSLRVIRYALSAAPANNFSGTVALACTGLPEAASCTFSPAQLNVTAGAPATTTLTISTVKSTVIAGRNHPIPASFEAPPPPGITRRPSPLWSLLHPAASLRLAGTKAVSSSLSSDYCSPLSALSQVAPAPATPSCPSPQLEPRKSPSKPPPAPSRRARSTNLTVQ